MVAPGGTPNQTEAQPQLNQDNKPDKASTIDTTATKVSAPIPALLVPAAGMKPLSNVTTPNPLPVTVTAASTASAPMPVTVTAASTASAPMPVTVATVPAVPTPTPVTVTTAPAIPTPMPALPTSTVSTLPVLVPDPFPPSSQAAVPISLFPAPATGPSPVKRKRGPVKGSKRKKKTVIDDEVACAIFRNLRLGNKFLNSGKLLAWGLQPDDKAFLDIHNYVARGQEHGFGIKILSIIRVIVNASSLYEGQDPLEYQLDFNEDPATKGKMRMMLWHGTRKEHLTSILENGLRLPYMRGQMFGAGVYFADRISKSAQYTVSGYQYMGHISYLLLCDVLLGNVYKSRNSMPATSAPPAGYNSIKGYGVRVPDKRMDKVIDDCIWPLGPTVDNTEDIVYTPYLRYNEYIVYDTKQVQPKYLLKVEFTPTPVHEKLE